MVVLMAGVFDLTGDLRRPSGTEAVFCAGRLSSVSSGVAGTNFGLLFLVGLGDACLSHGATLGLDRSHGGACPPGVAAIECLLRGGPDGTGTLLLLYTCLPGPGGSIGLAGIECGALGG